MNEKDYEVLTAAELDELSDGYEADEDITIPYVETRKTPLDGIFPDKYQIPDKYLTPVKRQFTSNCWTYAATCSLETFLLSHGKIPSNTDIYAVFSEAHFTYDMFDLDASGMKKNLRGKLPHPPTATKKKPGYGGNRTLAAAYYGRGGGAVANITDPALPKTSILTARSPETGAKKERKFYVTGYQFLADPTGAPPCKHFIDQIKYCLSDGTSVGISLLWNSTEFMNIKTSGGKETRSYYSPDNSMIPSGVKRGHHAVSVVGWDDTYSKSNFKTVYGSAPLSNGAFLCRNSHGTTNTWDGYFWLSYEDANMKGGSCVMDIMEDFCKIPRKVYARASFGMMEGIGQSASKVEFSVKYTTEEDDEELTHVGLFNLTPCVADVSMTPAGKAAITILKNYDLSYAGYHAVPIPSPQLIPAAGTDFTITCTYTPYLYGNVLAPCERHRIISGQDLYANIQLVKDTCYVNGTDLYTKKNTYGNIALYALMRKAGTQGSDLAAAYSSLSLPAPVENRIDNLPAAAGNQPLEWRLEPVEAGLYMPSYPASPLKKYSVGSYTGLINTSAAAPATDYITCIIGTGNFAMKKVFSVTLPAYSPGTYSFTLGTVANGNEVDISGTFPIPGAAVEISANDADTQTVTVDSKGNWSIKKFILYKDSWKDQYQNTSVHVTIYDDQKNVLSSGTSSVKLKRPFTFSETTMIATVTVLTSLGVLATIGWLINNYCCNGTVATCCCGGVELSGSIAGNKYLRLEDANLRNDGLIEEAASLNRVHKTKLDLMSNGTNGKSDFAGLAKKISKGGYVSNCSVSGCCDAGGANFGGLFLSGENVDVSDCSVHILLKNAGEYGGIAHTLSGSCRLKNVTVTGTADGESAAGIAVNLDGTVENAAVQLTVNATKNASGIAVSSSADVSQINVCGTFQSSDGNASGGVIHFEKGSITNTRVSGTISGKTGASGLAVTQKSPATISKCFTAGRITSSDGNAFGISPGISKDSSAVSDCLCVCSEISGAGSARISAFPSTACMAYDRIFSSNPLTSSGEVLKTAAELLEEATYAALDWDFKNQWFIDQKKKIPCLKNTTAAYDFPFPYAYPTQNGKYTFSVGNPIVFYGAKNTDTSKIKWSISSQDTLLRIAEPELLLSSDEFYLQLMLAGSSEAAFDFTLTSLLAGHEYSITFPISIIASV